MAHFRKLPSLDDTGFDPVRWLQVIPVTQRTSVYLMAGDDLEVGVKDSTIAKVAEVSANIRRSERSHASLTSWEKSVGMRKFFVTGKTVGETELRAMLAGTEVDFAKPLKIIVVSNADARQAPDGKNFSGPLRQELEKLSIREAVIRVGEDQLNSRLGRTADGGKGKYGIAASLDWCGAFAWWCWDTACRIKGLANPLGGNIDVLLSPQKAIHWVMSNPDRARLVRYQGTDPMTGKGKYAFADIDNGENKVEKADICLVRDDQNWRHVALVETPPSAGSFVTLDGNQGWPSIKKVTRDAGAKLANKSYKFVFVHLKV